MKNKHFFTIFALLLGLMPFTSRQAMGFTASFVTLGNCAICQQRIENAVMQMAGVHTVTWDIAADVTTVDYEEDVTDCYEIMHVIANVGHDTEWFRAPDSAYNLLIGSCCEYERTINYENVQVGYLSLMGIWLFPLGLEKYSRQQISVFPTIGSGIFHVTLSGKQSPEEMTLYICNMNGMRIKELTLNPGVVSTLDLLSFPIGQYLGILSDNKQIYSRVRLVKVQ